jgi:hypothetical protein
MRKTGLVLLLSLTIPLAAFTQQVAIQQPVVGTT